jgi:parallel beta-helix repeat protein
VTGNGNRIEGNQVTLNGVGIDVDVGGNLIIRNSARGNATDYLDDAPLGQNSFGPIVAAGTIATDNNPHANYAY